MNELVRKRIKGLKAAIFDFDGVFTNNQVLVSEDGKESVLCNRSDGLGMRLLEAEGIDTYILSTEINPVVQARAKKLKIECISGCADKGTAIRELASAKGYALDEISFVGNDANDLEAILIVGVGVAVADAFPEAKQAADWVLERTGGHGAVREFCERTVRERRELKSSQSPWYLEEVRTTYSSEPFEAPAL